MSNSAAAKMPTPSPRAEQDAARAERRRALLEYFAHPSPRIVEAAPALRAAADRYGDDTARELADLEAGRHPLQREDEPARD